MKRKYVPYDETIKPGYLQRRMALYRAQVQAEAERKAAAEKAAIAAQTAADEKVLPLIRAKHG